MARPFDCRRWLTPSLVAEEANRRTVAVEALFGSGSAQSKPQTQEKWPPEQYREAKELHCSLVRVGLVNRSGLGRVGAESDQRLKVVGRYY